MEEHAHTVSIVIPCFNSQEWIGETIESVAAQFYPRELMELVIVDDGSTDNTREIAKSLAKNSGIASTFLTLQNSGPSAARNAGWKNASGAWIQFLDSDDLLAPEKLKHQIQDLSLDIAAVYSPWTDLKLVGGKWKAVTETCRPGIAPQTLVDLIRSECFLHCNSLVFRKTWLEEVSGFNETYKLIEDVDLLLRLRMRGGVFHRIDSSQPLFFYRRRKDSLSRSEDEAFINGCVRNAILVEDHLRCKSGGFITPEERGVLLQVYSEAARFYFENERSRFRELYTRMLNLDPNYCPRSPAPLRFFSFFLGYQKAELLALNYRKVKRLFFPHESASA